MAMNRASFAKMLEPGLNTLFGLEYDRYPEEYGVEAFVEKRAPKWVNK